VPALERAWYLAVRGTPSLRGATTSFGASPPRFSASSRARVAPNEGLGRTTKQLGCIRTNDGVVDHGGGGNVAPRTGAGDSGGSRCEALLRSRVNIIGQRIDTNESSFRPGAPVEILRQVTEIGIFLARISIGGVEYAGQGLGLNGAGREQNTLRRDLEC
jgi:hypothetical protein